MLKIAIFASGKGSNFRAILDAMKAGSIPNAKVAVVVSNNPDAGALAMANEEHISAVHCSRKQYDSDNMFTQALLRILDEHHVNFIALAGYMKKIDSAIVRKYRNRIVNIHPALLPAFGGAGMYGMHVHEAVIKSGSKVSGATVHIVDEEYDRGPIVLQRTVEVSENDTPETLAAKVLKIEHQLYPEAIRLFAEGKVQLHHQEVTTK